MTERIARDSGVTGFSGLLFQIQPLVTEKELGVECKPWKTFRVRLPCHPMTTGFTATLQSLLDPEEISCLIADKPCQRFARAGSNYDTNTKWDCLFECCARKANANFLEYFLYSDKC